MRPQIAYSACCRANRVRIQEKETADAGRVGEEGERAYTDYASSESYEVAAVYVNDDLPSRIWTRWKNG